MTKRICITGAAGNLGSITSSYFLEKTDYNLNLMTHKKPISDKLKKNKRVTEFPCDLGNIKTLGKVFDNVDEIIHYAGVLFSANPEKFLPLTNTQFFRNLIEVAKQKKVKRIILISFPHVEGYSSSKHPATERQDRVPVSMHAKTRLEEEKILIENFPCSTILRVGMVYGKGILMPDAAKWLSKRRLLGVWKEPTEIHLISKDDFLESVVQTSNNQKAYGIYNIGDEGVQTLQEYLDFACTQWGSPKPWRMPLWMIYLAASVFELVSKIFGIKSPLTNDFIDIGRISYYGDTTRMKRDILPKLKYQTMEQGAEIF